MCKRICVETGEFQKFSKMKSLKSLNIELGSIWKIVLKLVLWFCHGFAVWLCWVWKTAWKLSLPEALAAFQRVKDKDVVTYNATITSCTKAGNVQCNKERSERWGWSPWLGTKNGDQRLRFVSARVLAERRNFMEFQQDINFWSYNWSPIDNPQTSLRAKRAEGLGLGWACRVVKRADRFAFSKRWRPSFWGTWGTHSLTQYSTTMIDYVRLTRFHWWNAEMPLLEKPKLHSFWSQEFRTNVFRTVKCVPDSVWFSLWFIVDISWH